MAVWLPSNARLVRLALVAVLLSLGIAGLVWRSEFAAIVAGLGDWGQKASAVPVATSARPATPVVVAAVSSRLFVDSFSTVATASPRESVVITAPVEDIVTRIAFEEGAEVARGDVLVELHADQARAALAAFRARLAEADAAYARALSLSQRGTIADATLEERRAERDVWRADVDRLSAELEDHVVLAPFSGTVGFRSVSIGSFVRPGSEITRLDDLSVMRAEFTAPERLLARIRPGLGVKVRAEAYPGVEFEGVVTLIEPRVNVQTRAVSMRAEIGNKDRLLKSGMLLRLELRLGSQNALAVPEGALLPVDDQVFVFRVADDVAERVPVTIGRRQDGAVEIRSGLREDDVVVVDGALRVRAGAEVEIVDRIDVDEPALRGGDE